MKLAAIAHPKRSWWIDPDGRVSDAGSSHQAALRDHPDRYGGADTPGAAVRAGWCRVGYYGGICYAQTRRLTRPQLHALQHIYLKLGTVPFEYQDDRTQDTYNVPAQVVLTAQDPAQLTAHAC